MTTLHTGPDVTGSPAVHLPESLSAGPQLLVCKCPEQPRAAVQSCAELCRAAVQSCAFTGSVPCHSSDGLATPGHFSAGLSSCISRVWKRPCHSQSLPTPPAHCRHIPSTPVSICLYNWRLHLDFIGTGALRWKQEDPLV